MTISFIAPVHDRAAQLSSTLSRIQMQNIKPLEFIVVQDGPDDGQTEQVCKQFKIAGVPVRYILRKNRPAAIWSNPAIPFNIGIKQAQGDIIIIQSPEVRFTKPTDLENIVAPIEADPNMAVFTICESLHADGSHRSWFSDHSISPSGMSCMAIRREKLLALGGFEETYIGYGFEDWDLCWRVQNSSTTMWAPDVIVQHQFHRTYEGGNYQADHERNSDQLAKVINDYSAGLRTLEANLGREWGRIES